MKKTNNTVLITGGASGIGLALAATFIKHGNQVIVCGRDEAKLTAAKKMLPDIHIHQTDVASPSDRMKLARTMKDAFPSLNVLVNNAGLIRTVAVDALEQVEALEAEVETNLVAPVALTNLLLPILRGNQVPTIVNVTTGYVFLPSVKTASYSATKTALRVMTRALRYKMRGAGVQVVEVCPPPVDTAMATHYRGKKTSPEGIAELIFDRLVRGQTEIVLGPSRLAKLLSRLMPEAGFRLMNYLEER